MSKLTEVLKLLCYDRETDGNLTFNVTEALTKNWEKIDAWASGIKSTIVGLVPGTRKVNGKALSEDLTLTGEDIKVSGSDETSISSSLSNKVMQIGNVTQSQVDNLNYDCTMVGSFQPHITGLPKTGYGIIVLYPYTDRNKQNGAQEIFYIDGERYWRKAVNDSVSEWFKVPTATPPVVSDLTLASGITKNYATYSIDQFGVVRVEMNVTKDSGFTHGEAIATLPVGVRPNKILKRVIEANGSPVGQTTRQIISVEIGTDGMVKPNFNMDTDASQVTNITGGFEFEVN